MDRGYVDFDRLYGFTANEAFFVTRTKKNVRLTRRYSHPVDTATGLRSDHTVVLTALESAKIYADPLRRIHYVDLETNKRLKFLTNNFSLPAPRHCPFIQTELAGGTLLQGDQAAPAHQGLFQSTDILISPGFPAGKWKCI